MKEDPIFGDPKVLQNLLERAKVQVFGTIKERAELISADREKCMERGYHRIEDDSENLLICYDCESWFGKDDGFDYKIIPL